MSALSASVTSGPSIRRPAAVVVAGDGGLRRPHRRPHADARLAAAAIDGRCAHGGVGHHRRAGAVVGGTGRWPVRRGVGRGRARGSRCRGTAGLRRDRRGDRGDGRVVITMSRSRRAATGSGPCRADRHRVGTAAGADPDRLRHRRTHHMASQRRPRLPADPTDATQRHPGHPNAAAFVPPPGTGQCRSRATRSSSARWSCRDCWPACAGAASPRWTSNTSLPPPRARPGSTPPDQLLAKLDEPSLVATIARHIPQTLTADTSNNEGDSHGSPHRVRAHRPHHPPAIIDWVDEVAELTTPDQVVWCDGSDEEWQRLTDAAGRGRHPRPADPTRSPNSFWARSDPSRRGPRRGPHLHLLATTRPTPAPPTTGWPRPR